MEAVKVLNDRVESTLEWLQKLDNKQDKYIEENRKVLGKFTAGITNSINELSKAVTDLRHSIDIISRDIDTSIKQIYNDIEQIETRVKKIEQDKAEAKAEKKDLFKKAKYTLIAIIIAGAMPYVLQVIKMILSQ